MRKKFKMKNSKFKIKGSRNCRGPNTYGFTLIELLVVISIIAILTSFLTANFIGVRQKARDAQRKSDLKQIQSALELYRSDNGAYPGSLPACGNALLSGSTTYMQKIPCDPLSKNSYSYTAGTPPYKLSACLENSNDQDLDSPLDTVACPSNSNSYSFTVNNP